MLTQFPALGFMFCDSPVCAFSHMLVSSLDQQQETPAVPGLMSTHKERRGEERVISRSSDAQKELRASQQTSHGLKLVPGLVARLATSWGS